MPFSILLAAVLTFHAAFGGAGGVAVLCLGGGHQHASVEAGPCVSACGHDAVWPLPIPTNDREHDCGCTDVELTIAELLTLPRNDDGGQIQPAILFTAAWGVVVCRAGLGRRGPPMPPPWFDPGVAHRLSIVASVRLTL